MKKDLVIFDDEKYSLKTTISFLILIMVFSAFFGFIYETIFYKIDLGYFVKRGSSYGPWIPIYAFGGVFITVLTYRLRKNPFLVFISNCLITGVLEYSTGFVLYEVFKTRLWDYNVEIWNWGNINGYICFRSVAFLGLSSLFLIYIMIPVFKKLISKMSENKLAIISYSLGIIFALDVILHLIFA